MSKSLIINRSVSQYYWHFVTKYKYRFIALFATTAFWSIATSVSPLMIKLMIDNVVKFKGDPANIYSIVKFPALMYIALRIFVSLFARIENILQVYTLPKIKAEMREQMFQHTLNHSLDFFQEAMSGNVANKILNMAGSFERIYVAIHEGLFPCLISFLASAIILYLTVPLFALFFVIWFCLSVLITFSMSTRSIQFSNDRAEAESAVAGDIVDTFRNILTVLSFFNKKYEFTYLEKVQKKEILTAKRLEWQLLRIHLFRSISTTIMLICMIIFLIEGWRYGWITVGDFSFISSTAFSIAHLTWHASKEFMTLYKEWGIAKQALGLLQVPFSNLDLPNAKNLKVSNGMIQFKNVSFKYPAGSEVFKNQNITILPGQRVGLVGFSGSGKTTFVKLVMRFFKPQNGMVEIDGQNLNQVTTSSIRQAIAFIPQQPGLFNRTVSENISYGYPSATFSEIEAAAKEAQCENFILNLDEKYHTIIGEQGDKLSAGQRQRLAIARAAIKPQTKILILDEATAALDSITEQKIQISIDQLMQGKTAIVIAHRLSTLKHLDRILVFDNGQVVEDGDHDTLIKQNGQYARLWSMQSEGLAL